MKPPYIIVLYNVLAWALNTYTVQVQKSQTCNPSIKQQFKSKISCLWRGSTVIKKPSSLLLQRRLGVWNENIHIRFGKTGGKKSRRFRSIRNCFEFSRQAKINSNLETFLCIKITFCLISPLLFTLTSKFLNGLKRTVSQELRWILLYVYLF